MFKKNDVIYFPILLLHRLLECMKIFVINHVGYYYYFFKSQLLYYINKNLQIILRTPHIFMTLFLFNSPINIYGLTHLYTFFKAESKEQ